MATAYAISYSGLTRAHEMSNPSHVLKIKTIDDECLGSSYMYVYVYVSIYLYGLI